MSQGKTKVPRKIMLIFYKLTKNMQNSPARIAVLACLHCCFVIMDKDTCQTDKNCFYIKYDLSILYTIDIQPLESCLVMCILIS